MLIPHTVFFDVGNTLVSGLENSVRRILGERLTLCERDVKRLGRLIMTEPVIDVPGLAKTVKRQFPHLFSIHLEQTLGAVWEDQRNAIREITGATDVLRSLKNRGIRLGVLSNTWHPAYEGFCRSCPEILALLDFKILSYRERCKKPSPEIFKKALQISRVPVEECWMVGDSYEMDIEPAQKMGMHGLWVFHHPEREKDELLKILRREKQMPDWVVENLCEIAGLWQMRV